jgi:hypothetical protein
MQYPREIRSAHSEGSDLVSCLCVTEDRPAFLPWLLWNYEKQDYSTRELVIVDSSRTAEPSPCDPAITVVRCPPQTSVARKRNLAVEAARGTVITWFDDDDWQHPQKVSILAAALEDGQLLAGPRQSWFVDLHRGRARPHTSQRSVIFNGVGVRREALDFARFDEQRIRAADTAWLVSVQREARCSPVVIGQVLTFWLCHRQNVSNPATKFTFPSSIDAVRDAVGRLAWGETDHAIAQLRDRLGGSARGSH